VLDRAVLDQIERPSAPAAPPRGFTLIYRLVDPRREARCDGRVSVYVGGTSRPARRYREHVENAVAGCSTPRSRWIRSLLRAGVAPVMVQVEVVRRGADAVAAERFYIGSARASRIKFPKNAPGTVGGEGLHKRTGAPGRAQARVYGSREEMRASPEWRERVCAATRARVADPAYSAKLSAAMRAAYAKPEPRGKLCAMNRARSLPAVLHRDGVAWTFPAFADAASALGVNRGHVSRVARGEVRSVHGWRVTYAREWDGALPPGWDGSPLNDCSRSGAKSTEVARASNCVAAVLHRDGVAWLFPALTAIAQALGARVGQVCDVARGKKQSVYGWRVTYAREWDGALPPGWDGSPLAVARARVAASPIISTRTNCVPFS
jgi:hypothetical protein